MKLLYIALLLNPGCLPTVECLELLGRFNVSCTLFDKDTIRDTALDKQLCVGYTEMRQLDGPSDRHKETDRQRDGHLKDLQYMQKYK